MSKLIIEEAVRSCPQDQVLSVINATESIRDTLQRYGRAFRGCRCLVKAAGIFLVHYDSALADEALDIWALLPEIERIVAEPGKIRYELDGEWHRYTPDFLLYLRDGRRIVVEIKPLEEAYTPANQLRWEFYTTLFAQYGVIFVVLTEEQIRNPVLRANLGEICAQRSLQLTERTKAIIEQLSVDDPKRFYSLAQRAGDRRQILAALAQGVLECDLYSPLHSTLVWRAQPC